MKRIEKQANIISAVNAVMETIKTQELNAPVFLVVLKQAGLYNRNLGKMSNTVALRQVLGLKETDGLAPWLENALEGLASVAPDAGDYKEAVCEYLAEIAHYLSYQIGKPVGRPKGFSPKKQTKTEEVGEKVVTEAVEQAA